MTKKIAIGAALLFGAMLATATGSFAQGYYGGPYDAPGYYDFAPYSGPSNRWNSDDRYRGGPGPRVMDGSGSGVGSVR